jgi:hypothetical protein
LVDALTCEDAIDNIGLGHLGQASAWVISWIPYTDPSGIEAVLQDTDDTTPANYSTGVLTPEGSNGVPKTRLTAAALENAGLTPPDHRTAPRKRLPGERHVALPAWQPREPHAVTIPLTAAVADLQEHHDPCGVTELAGKAVGAAFVGVTAGCLAIAEALRELHGGTGHNTLLLSNTSRARRALDLRAPADDPDVIPFPAHRIRRPPCSVA